MKKIIAIALVFFVLKTSAQTVSGITANKEGSFGEFSAWTKQEVKFDDGSNMNFEYRIALIKRVGIGCHYQIEIRNNGDKKYVFEVKSHYYDKFVKSRFGDKGKEKIKPGAIQNFHFVAQGCKKDKDVERTDYQHCTACDMTVDITVLKD